MTDAIAPTTAAPPRPPPAIAGTVHSVREIEALIPHRWPMLLVDRIVEYDPEAKRIVGIKGVTATEWFFQGHFPGLPVMPGVLQVEALAQTMAVYVAKQPGFGDRIGLFAGIDEVRFKRIVVPGDTLRLEVTMEKLGSGSARAAASRASTARSPARGSCPSSSRPPARCDDPDRGPVRRPRQPASRSRPTRQRSRRERPTSILVAGDLVLNGPDPAPSSTRCARWRPTARRRPGQHGHRGGRLRLRRRLPAVPGRRARTAIRTAAEWAHDELSDEQLAGSAACPAERRVRADDDSLVLVVHASPGSQTRGFDQALDANVIFERARRTDARVICVGHTHIPEVRDLGWKVIVNGGCAGYVFDGDPTASWALVDDRRREVNAEIRRTPFDVLAVANAISARGLPGDVYRAATVRTGKLVR